MSSPETITASTPIPISPRTRTVLLVVGLIAAVLLLRAMPTVPRLLLGAATLALLLSFPVRLLARFMRRGLAILTTILALNVLVILALLVLVPALVEQLIALVNALPTYIADFQRAIDRLVQPLRDAGVLPASPGEVAGEARQGFFEQSQEWIAAALEGLLALFAGALGGIVQTFLTLLIALYLLIDVERVKGAAVRLAPARYRGDAETLWTALGLSVSRYLGGLAFSMAEQGALVALGSWLIGIPYPILFGVWFGLTAVIPYLGAWLGAVPLVLIAFLAGGLVQAALALALVLAVNMFDSNIVQPNVQGHALNVHPILIMLAVIGGGQLAGALGAVFALPVLGMLRVTADFFAARLVVQAPPPPVVVTIPGAAIEATGAVPERQPGV